MTVIIGFVNEGKAFIPELYAYRSCFSQIPKAEVVVFDDYHSAVERSDILFLFMGVFPFWLKRPRFLITEYHSLSTGRYPRIKDLIKSVFNIKGDVSVFLNEKVRSALPLVGGEYKTRCMGFDGELAKKYANSKKEFDFVYSGSLREGVEPLIKDIANKGYSIIVVGADQDFLEEESNVVSVGKVSLEKSYEYMSKAQWGLNIVPDYYPYNIQDSTKVVEYLSLGLGVATNRYEWVVEFENFIGANFIYYNDAWLSEIEAHEFSSGDIECLEWSRLIKESCLFESIYDMVQVCASDEK
jgi:hypothetical protein